MSPWTLGAIAIAGGLCGVLIANILITIRHLGDMQDVWSDDDDV